MGKENPKAAKFTQSQLQQQQQQEEEDKQKKLKGLTKTKQHKLQKIKEKYADQDEEERNMRLQLLGAKKVKGLDKQIQKIQNKQMTSGGKGNAVSGVQGSQQQKGGNKKEVKFEDDQPEEVA